MQNEYSNNGSCGGGGGSVPILAQAYKQVSFSSLFLLLHQYHNTNNNLSTGDQQCHIKSYSWNIFILYLWIKLLLLFNQANGGGRRQRLWLLSTVIQIRSATRHECNTTLLRNFCPELSWVEFGQHFIITFSIKSLPKWIPGLFKSHSTTLWQFNGITTYLATIPYTLPSRMNDAGQNVSLSLGDYYYMLPT